MSVVDLINLIASIASLILSILAIWLSLQFYEQSKQSEKQTEVNVSEIKTQTQALTNISSRMLDKYTDYATQPKAADETFTAVVQLLGQTQSNARNLESYPTNNNNADLQRYGIGATIAAMFYAGFANLAVQDLLPMKASEIENENNLPLMLNSSKDDYDSLYETLNGVDISVLSDSALANLYQIATGWKGNSLIKNMDELYIAPNTESKY